MERIKKAVTGISLLLTDSVILCCLLCFTVLIQKTEQFFFNLPLLFGLAAVSFLLNLMLAAKSRSLLFVALFNACIIAFGIAAVCVSFHSEPESFALKVFLAFAVAVIEGHGIYLAVASLNAEHATLLFDALVLVFAVFLYGCRSQDFNSRTLLLVVGFLCVGLHFFTLISLRTAPGTMEAVQGEMTGGRVGIYLFPAIILLAALFLCGAFSMQAAGIAQGFWSACLLFFKGIKTAFSNFGEFCRNIILRFYHPELYEQGTPEAAPSAADNPVNQAVAVPEIPQWLVYTVVIVICALLAWLVIHLLFKLRHIRTKPKSVRYRPVKVTRQNISQKSDSFARRWKNRLQLSIWIARRKNTPEGLAWLLKKTGEKAGIPMKPSESWHGYVRRLLSLAQADGNTATWTLLAQCALDLEQYFYADDKNAFSTARISDCRRAVRLLFASLRRPANC